MTLRTLQLSISISLLLCVVAGSIHTMITIDRRSFVMDAVMIIVFTLITWHNLRFDWKYLKINRYDFSPPKDVWVILAVIAFIPILFYAAKNLHATYDSHLSMYDVAVQMPQTWWEPESQWAAELILASRERGIFTLFFYILALSIFSSAYLSGRVSSFFEANKVIVQSWLAIGSRLILATVGLVVAVLLSRDLINSFLYIIREGNEYPELRLFVNVAPPVLASLNAIVMLTYSIWLFVHGTRALRVKTDLLKKRITKSA